MVFSTHIFLFYFLPLALGVYYLLHACGLSTARTVWLTLVSYIFYGWERPDFCVLIAASSALDFTCGRIVARPDHPRRKLALTASVVGNLSLLAYFKYWNFGVDSVSRGLEALGLEGLSWPQVTLPIGISFYTFQTMSYTIDIYRGHARPARGFMDLACYVALFPQLVAGPIVRYRTIAEQLRERRHDLARFGHGALRFMIGFAKKILLANSAGEIADAVFDGGGEGAAAAWMGVVAYALQIYFDFSAYSDMAIGLGRMFGFVFPENFDSPYRSRSITEFWRRWHISLSTWLRDYLYVPLGGNRKGPGRTYLHLFLTMLLGGLWHGAQWTFVAWGAFHGTLLALERMRGKRAPWGFLPGFLQVAVTFVLVLVGWVFFRADSFERAGSYLLSMGGLNGWGAGVERIQAVEVTSRALALLALVLTWAGIPSDRVAARGGWIASLLASVVFLVAIGHMFFQQYNPFLYFRF